MERRTVKQIIYGIFYLLVLAIILAATYFIFLKPSPTCFDNKQNQNEQSIDCGGVCIPCGAKYAEPLKITQLNNSPAGNKKTVLLAEIKNPNLDFGAQEFSYKFNFLDSQGSKISEVSGRSFIYSGEVKYLINVVEIDSKDFSKTELEFSNYKWISKEEFKKPDITVKEFKTEIYNPQAIRIPIYTFTRDLYTGIKGEDISKLQEFLRADKSYNGAITGIFDLKTKNALISYQKAHSLTPAKGYFDQNTRDFINAKIEEVKKMISETAEIYPVSISGILTNNDIISASKVIVNGFIYDNFGLLVGVSKTELENLSPTDERDFKIIFPQNIDVATINQNVTKVYVDAIR